MVDVDSNYEKDNTIRKITPAGVVSTFVGLAAGTAHADDSTGGVNAATRFGKPTGIATDRAGNVYVVDRGNVNSVAREEMNSNIRKITAAGVVTTFAGTTAELKMAKGWADGVGNAARFDGPEGVATDSAGNVYVTNDGVNRAIRKISPDGVVRTLRGQQPYHDLRSLATDSAGNVYTTETFTRNVGGRSYTGIDIIRKTTPSGAVKLLAGESAKLNYPDGVAVDSAGNIYVADSGNHRILKITPRRFFGNDVSTFTGPAADDGSTDGVGVAAHFSEPRGVTTDSADNIYVTDRNSIRKITPAGVVTTFAGDANSSGSVDGYGVAARFNAPLGVAADRAGNVYLSDSAHTIRKITPAGVVSTFAGKAGVTGSNDGAGAAARFNNPYGIATDGEDNLYVADASNSTIRKITSAGVVSTFAGKAGVTGNTDGVGAAARFNFPQSVAVDRAGNIYVADRGNYTVRKITPQGVVSGLAGAGEHGNTNGIGAAASFGVLVGVALDNAGNVYVADSDNYTNTIRKITPAGVVSTFAGAGNGNLDDVGTKARFGTVKGVAIDSVGNVYVTDKSNGTIRKITPAGVVSTFAGIGNWMGSADGVATAARFNYPRGVATDNADNVYVADSNNHTIRKITPAGVVSTFAGTAGVSGSADGVGAAARFNYPGRMAIDSAGNIYVVDNGNHTIRKISPTGVVSTLVGKVGQVGFAAGALPGVIAFPKAVAVHGTSLYITMRDGVAVVRNINSRPETHGSSTR